MNRILKLIFHLFCCSFFVMTGPVAQGSDILELPKPELIMNRLHNQKSELDLALGYMPVGAMNKYILTSASYINFYNETHGWEIVNVVFPIEIPSSLKKALAASPYNAKPTELPTLDFMLSSNYVYSPFYSKSVLFNSKVIYSQISVIGGLGLASFNVGSFASLNMGLNLKFFSKDFSSFKFDFRYYSIMSNLEVLKTQMSLAGVYCYDFE